MTRLANTLLSVLAGAALVQTASAQEARQTPPSPVELARQVEDVAAVVKNAESQLRVVETQYTERPEPTNDEALARRFSNGEIQYLLGDYKGASVLFYDLVSDKSFTESDRYPDALFYLADALYQQQNYIGARLYLRLLLNLKGKHYREALARYLEIAGRLNEFQGIDDYINQAKGLSGGALPPELSYVYGKWLFKRTDLPQEERLNRARAAFEPLAAQPGPAHLQAMYFLGVALVQERKFDEAIEQFRKITREVASNPRDLKVKELANLSLGRLLYEIGRYDEALDRYQEIPQDSEYFVDSLYEIAWTQVKKGEFEKARNATDILLLVAPDSTIAPEARILQGHLLLKLKKYDEATETYNGVINTYAPVRDEIDALLTVNKDPVAYFDNLLARNDRNLDVAQLLPPVALKWATTQREVADAVHIVDDLEVGRRGVAESRDIANRILKALDERGLEIFPELQDGYTRADAVDNDLTRAQQNLVGIEKEMLVDRLSADERSELDNLRAQRERLREKFANLPKTQEEVDARKKKLQRKIDALARQAFEAAIELQGLYAQLAAIDKWVDDTRSQRHNTPEEEKAFKDKLRAEIENVTALEKDLDRVRKALQDERETVDTSIGGEAQIRNEYEALLMREHELLSRAEAQLSPEASKIIQRVHEIRGQLLDVRARVKKAKGQIRAAVKRRGEIIREKVLAERQLLDGYEKEVAAVSGDARNLVGRIAFDSFRRVRQQFYDLVLKADVGVVDVAFTRKQDKTAEIQRLSQEKDHELKALDEEFKEVLKDVD
ncbi:MAG: tetratricopeptide repeat protein [Myxococcaceae bacterium]|nr:tetratricopeptide repeat protein [Myxococcaceae bacterium]